MNANLRYQKSKELGISDDQIAETFAKKDPLFKEKYQKSLELGKSPEEIFSMAYDYYDRKKKAELQKSQEQKSFTQGAADFLTESEDLEKDVERQRARGTSRILERTLGIPGDVMKLIEGITGRKAKNFPLPSSSSLQQKSEELTQGYTSPKNELEQKSDEFLGDVASSLLPGGPGYSMARNIGIPLAGSLAKEGLKSLGGEEKSSNYAKMGTMFLLDLISNRRATIPRQAGVRGALDMGGPQSYVSNLFREAEAALPQQAHMVPAQQLQQSLTNLRNTLQRGGTRQSRAKALNAIEELESRIQNGQIDVREIPEFRTRINEDIQQLGGWDFQTPPAIRERAVNNLSNVKRHVIQAGEDYGRTQNPQFLEAWRNANEAQSVLSRSNVVSNAVQNAIGDRIISKGVRSLFGLGGGATIAHKAGINAAIASGATGATLAGIYGAGKLLYRVIQSPTLRQYYFNTINAALNGEKGALLKNITDLNDAIEKEDNKSSLNQAKKDNSTKNNT